MKNIFTVTSSVFLIFLGMSMASCTKDYTCQCKMTYEGSPGLPEETIKEYPIKDTKSNARSICEGNSKVYEDGGIKTIEECSLW